jgi:hypothetical protein
MHRHRRRVLRAHLTTDGQPIASSMICCCCEDDAGHRMGSWMQAKESSDYNGGSRTEIPEGRCAFCGRTVRAPA